LLLGSSQKLVY